MFALVYSEVFCKYRDSPPIIYNLPMAISQIMWLTMLSERVQKHIKIFLVTF